MSKDYKPRSNRTTTGSPFLSGFLIGLLLGVMITVALTMYIQGDTSPFRDNKNKTASSIKPLIESIENEKSTDKSGAKDKLDFYTILPKTESTVTEQEMTETNITTKKEDYFLQVGSFKNEDDADNLKAKLALQGFESIVQTAAIPEQGTWHRVRVGPLNNIETINKIRAKLLANEFSADLIKVETETKSE
jgi:cell division protein FtsN